MSHSSPRGQASRHTSYSSTPLIYLLTVAYSFSTKEGQLHLASQPLSLLLVSSIARIHTQLRRAVLYGSRRAPQRCSPRDRCVWLLRPLDQRQYHLSCSRTSRATIRYPKQAWKECKASPFGCRWKQQGSPACRAASRPAAP